MNWTRICYPDGHLDLRSLRFVSPLRPALLGQFGKFLPGFCTHRGATTRFLWRSALFSARFLARGRALVLALSPSLLHRLGDTFTSRRAHRTSFLPGSGSGCFRLGRPATARCGREESFECSDGMADAAEFCLKLRQYCPCDSFLGGVSANSVAAGDAVPLSSRILLLSPFPIRAADRQECSSCAADGELMVGKLLKKWSRRSDLNR